MRAVVPRFMDPARQPGKANARFPATLTRPQPRQARAALKAWQHLASLPPPVPQTLGRRRPLSLRTALRARRAGRTVMSLTGANQDAKPSTSTIASANACGASCGRLCPTPPVMTRCAYLPENFLA